MINQLNEMIDFSCSYIRDVCRKISQIGNGSSLTFLLLVQSPVVSRNILKSVDRTSFDVYRLERAKADKYGKVRYAKNLYSTFPTFAQKEVWLKITYNCVIVLNDEYNIVIGHPLWYGEGLELMARRPRSLQNLSFYKEFYMNL